MITELAKVGKHQLPELPTTKLTRGIERPRGGIRR